MIFSLCMISRESIFYMESKFPRFDKRRENYLITVNYNDMDGREKHMRINRRANLCISWHHHTHPKIMIETTIREEGRMHNICWECRGREEMKAWWSLWNPTWSRTLFLKRSRILLEFSNRRIASPFRIWIPFMIWIPFLSWGQIQLGFPKSLRLSGYKYGLELSWIVSFKVSLWHSLVLIVESIKSLSP